jgi:hypothetical protein
MKRNPWQPPSDLDPECLALCVALNKMPGIQTTDSCCGHGKNPYWIFFQPTNLASLPRLLYWFDSCHCGCRNWRVIAYTDCSADRARFMVEGPVGAYDDAKHIAELIEKDLKGA